MSSRQALQIPVGDSECQVGSASTTPGLQLPDRVCKNHTWSAKGQNKLKGSATVWKTNLQSCCRVSCIPDRPPWQNWFWNCVHHVQDVFAHRNSFVALLTALTLTPQACLIGQVSSPQHGLVSPHLQLHSNNDGKLCNLSLQERQENACTGCGS